MTDNFDPNNPKHALSKHLIEKGNGLPDIEDTRTIEKHLADAGFKVGNNIRNDPNVYLLISVFIAGH